MRRFGDSGADVADTNESNTFTFSVDVPLTILRAAQAIANEERNLLTPTAQDYSDTSNKKRKRARDDEQGSEDVRPLVRQRLRLEQIISAPAPSLTEDQIQEALKNPSTIQQLIADLQISLQNVQEAEAIFAQYQAEVINLRSSQVKLENLQTSLRRTAEFVESKGLVSGATPESAALRNQMEQIHALIQGTQKTLSDLEPRVGYLDEMQEQTRRRRAVIEAVMRNLITVAEAQAVAASSDRKLLLGNRKGLASYAKHFPSPFARGT
ncbi:hypothetical protein CVT26_005765 [Gymnopilus dilepis]|uniref:Uncharacterized protein n=1 Tax=Gymnopilus dilepis TaxID=231916 RepID=A0A409VPJ2_9AGAR|nr:hypothetical protein CVT26_005765 [Gymnopilus dilepis]